MGGFMTSRGLLDSIVTFSPYSFGQWTQLPQLPELLLERSRKRAQGSFGGPLTESAFFCEHTVCTIVSLMQQVASRVMAIKLA